VKAERNGRSTAFEEVRVARFGWENYNVPRVSRR
jgi:hypothetical protein